MEKMSPILWAIFALFAFGTTSGFSTARDYCESNSCIPYTGNLLIGREHRLRATSTCGLEREERYCIPQLSSEGTSKKCFKCDSGDRTLRNPILNHRIENVVNHFAPGTQQRTWWQSQAGVQNVSVELQLETAFYMTHMIVHFKSPRPAAMVLEKSHDFGKTWQVYRYYAYDCDTSFPGVSKGPLTSIGDVICESRYSFVAPQTDGEVIFRVLSSRLSDIDDPYSEKIQNLITVTNLRLNFTKMHALMDDEDTMYYAIYDMTVRGSCICNGHASRCLQFGDESKTDMIYGRCDCQHNTEGINCEKCKPSFYLASGKRIQDVDACQACACDMEGSLDSQCDNITGQCRCRSNFTGRDCSQKLTRDEDNADDNGAKDQVSPWMSKLYGFLFRTGNN